MNVLLILVVLIAVYLYCTRSEQFYIPPDMVTGGDFHIQPPGAIADEGSFTNVMDDYLYGE